MAERVDPTMLYYGKVYENICRKENINEINGVQISVIYYLIGEKEYSTMTPFLNFVSDDEDQFVPKELKRFSFDLKMAKKIGEAGKNTDICQGSVIINNVCVTVILKTMA